MNAYCSQDRIRTYDFATIKDVIDHLSHYAIPDYLFKNPLYVNHWGISFVVREGIEPTLSQYHTNKVLPN